MKKVILSLMIIATIGTAKEKEWYEYNTLHGKTLADWKVSRLVEKLSTCADFVSAKGTKTRDWIMQAEDTVFTQKVFATDLAICIDQSYVKNNQHLEIAKLATECMILMGYFKE